MRREATTRRSRYWSAVSTVCRSTSRCPTNVCPAHSRAASAPCATTCASSSTFRTRRRRRDSSTSPSSGPTSTATTTNTPYVHLSVCLSPSPCACIVPSGVSRHVDGANVNVCLGAKILGLYIRGVDPYGTGGHVPQYL